MARFILTLSLVLITSGVLGCAPSYKWRLGGHKYLAVEHGRALELVDLDLSYVIPRRFNGWGTVLLERCGDRVSQDVPCFPGDHHPTQQDIAQIDAAIPAYRAVDVLLSAAVDLDVRAGAGRTAYVMGTDPIIIAYLDDLSESVSRVSVDSARSSEDPGADVRTRRGSERTGTITRSVNGIRLTRLVHTDDLKVLHANVLLFYPESLSFQSTGGGTQWFGPPLQALYLRKVVLRRTVALGEIFNAILSEGGVNTMTATVENVPLSGFNSPLLRSLKPVQSRSE